MCALFRFVRRGAFILFIKKVADRYAENFRKSVKLNIGDSSRSILYSGNGTAADVHRNGLKLVRKTLLTHLLGDAELPHLASNHVFSFAVYYARHFIFSFEVFVLTQDNYYDILFWKKYCPVTGQPDGKLRG